MFTKLMYIKRSRCKMMKAPKIVSVLLSATMLCGLLCYLPADMNYNVCTISVSAAGTLSAPQQIKASFSNDRKSAKITWNNVKGAEAYKIYVLNTKTNSYEFYDIVLENSCVINDLFPENKFYVKVVSLNETTAGYEECGASIESFIMPEYTAQVSEITSSPSNKSVTLSWKKTNGADCYEIGREVNGKYKKLKTTSGLTTKITGLTPNTTYKVTVYPVIKANGKSYKGKAKTITIKTTLKEWSVTTISSADWLTEKKRYEVGEKPLWEHIYGMDDMSAYDAKNQKFYFFKNTDMDYLYVYDLKTNKTSTVYSYKKLKYTLFGDTDRSDSILSNNYVDDYDLFGITCNDYSGDIYIYGGSWKNSTLCLYNLTQKKKYSLSAKISYNDSIYYSGVYNEKTLFYRIQFIDKNSFLFKDRLNKDGKSTEYAHYNRIYNLKTGENHLCGYSNMYARIFMHKENYYAIKDTKLYNLGNIYDPKDELITTLPANWDSMYEYHVGCGFDYYKNNLYFKDSNNDIYKINLDDFTQKLYVSSEDIEETSKSFLEKDKCYGLNILDDDHFIVYDISDGRIKLVTRGS